MPTDRPAPGLAAVGASPASNGAARGFLRHDAFTVPGLLRVKGATTVSVCIPARNAEATIARVVRPLQPLAEAGLVDEIVVIDHSSTDSTVATARRAGARVVDADRILPEHGPVLGKGDVLWRSLLATEGDIVVWLDADLSSVGPHYVLGLVGPLLTDRSVSLVRATHRRALGGDPGEGGQVTELLAKPLISMLFPDLKHVRQPLGGEYALRREVAATLDFEPDYGVEIGLLLDVAESRGVEAIAQVDLGDRRHRGRSPNELRAQSREVLRACLTRAAPHASVRGVVPLRPALGGSALHQRPLAG